jgi:hypothetical protein
VNSDSTVRTVGTTNCYDPFTNSDCQAGPCTEDKVASFWDNTAVATLPALTGDYQRVGRGVNEAGDAVGYAIIAGEQQGTCNEFATYWPDGSGVEPLANYLPDGEEGDRSRAEAINGLALPQVVGSNEDEGAARLWEKQSSGDLFLGTDLNATGVIACQARWDLRFSHDINDDAWIVVTASRTLSAGPYSSTDTFLLLLTPFNDCPADVTQNGCIDNDDLLEVINNWGECDPGVFCFADTNGTTHVNTDDLLDVTNAWCDEEGEDCEEECCMNCSVCEESLMGGSSTTLQDLINATLESDIASNEQLDITEILIAHLG